MPDTPTTTHTIDEALERFQLIGAPMSRRERTRAAAFWRALRLLDEVDGL